MRVILQLIVTALVAAPAWAAAPAALQCADVNEELTALHVRGALGPGMPAVSVGGERVQALTNDGTFLAARLPAGFAPGNHVVAITTADGRTASSLAALFPGACAARAAEASRPPPVIESAVPNADLTLLELTGHFGTGMPAVSLDGVVALQPLLCDGTFLPVLLPAGLAPGKHLVLVKTAEGRAGALQVVLGR